MEEAVVQGGLVYVELLTYVTQPPRAGVAPPLVSSENVIFARGTVTAPARAIGVNRMAAAATMTITSTASIFLFTKPLLRVPCKVSNSGYRFFLQVRPSEKIGDPSNQ